MARMYQFKDDKWTCTDCHYQTEYYDGWKSHDCNEHIPFPKVMMVEDFDDAPGPGEPNYIIFTYPSQDTEVMFRAPQMIMVAERQKGVVVFGVDTNAPATDPNRKKSRVFMESDNPLVISDSSYTWNHHASKWMRETVTKYDLSLRRIVGPVVLEERCQEGAVILAPDSLDMRVNGGGMGAVNMNKFGKKAN